MNVRKSSKIKRIWIIEVEKVEKVEKVEANANTIVNDARGSLHLPQPYPLPST